jgi:hypothetical protein
MSFIFVDFSTTITMRLSSLAMINDHTKIISDIFFAIIQYI